MTPYLPPIDRPKGLGMKLAYYFTRKRFGKVLTPLRVHAARLPMAFGMFYARIGELDKKLTISKELAMLIRQRLAQLNICEFCIDIGRAETIRDAALSQAKFDALHDYATSDLFSAAEKAALDYAGELTVQKKVSGTTFARLRQHYTEREVCEIVFVIASEHVYNLTNIGLNIHSDMLCDIRRRQ